MSRFIKDKELYYNIRPYLKTGDIVFFRGGESASNMISKIEKKLTHNGLYTHVGLILLSNSFPIGSPYRFRGTSSGSGSGSGNCNDNMFEYVIPYVIESTMSGKLSDGVLNIEGYSFLGVQIRKLDEVIEAYDKDTTTHIAIGHLKCDLYDQHINSNLNVTKIIDIVREFNGISYDVNCFDLFAAAYKKLRKIRNFFKKYCICFRKKNLQFCSELVANIYIKLGILNPLINAEDVLPVDFYSENGEETFDTDKLIPVLFESIVPITVYSSKLNTSYQSYV